MWVTLTCTCVLLPKQQVWSCLVPRWAMQKEPCRSLEWLFLEPKDLRFPRNKALDCEYFLISCKKYGWTVIWWGYLGAQQQNPGIQDTKWISVMNTRVSASPKLTYQFTWHCNICISTLYYQPTSSYPGTLQNMKQQHSLWFYFKELLLHTMTYAWQLSCLVLVAAVSSRCKIAFYSFLPPLFQSFKTQAMLWL